jgi:hypothetical protein
MSRIKNILELLSLDNYYGIHPAIDQAKGIDKLPETWRELKDIAKRKAIQNRKWKQK